MDNEDVKFEQRLAEKRHKELTGSLSGIVQVLSGKNNTDIIEAIDKQTDAVNELVVKLSEIEKPEAPKVNVEVNQKEVVLSVSEMSSKILQGFVELKQTIIDNHCEPSKEWDFFVQRDERGFIKKVTAVKIK